MGYSFFKIILSVFMVIDSIVDIKDKVFDSIVFFCLINSLFWAFLIPKIICDEICKKIILS